MMSMQSANTVGRPTIRAVRLGCTYALMRCEQNTDRRGGEDDIQVRAKSEQRQDSHVHVRAEHSV